MHFDRERCLKVRIDQAELQRISSTLHRALRQGFRDSGLPLQLVWRARARHKPRGLRTHEDNLRCQFPNVRENLGQQH